MCKAAARPPCIVGSSLGARRPIMYCLAPRCGRLAARPLATLCPMTLKLLCDISSRFWWRTKPGRCRAISGLFSARGYNIESLTVAPTEDATMSRMTIVTVGSDDVIEQITKQLNKLVEVVKVIDLTDGNHIERELMLVKVRAAGKDRDEMKRLAGHLSRPHSRRHRQELHHRTDRHRVQARCVPAGDRARRDSGNGAHRRVGHRARRAHFAES